jgi:hypothetical protein
MDGLTLQPFTRQVRTLIPIAKNTKPVALRFGSYRRPQLARCKLTNRSSQFSIVDSVLVFVLSLPRKEEVRCLSGARPRQWGYCPTTWG